MKIFRVLILIVFLSGQLVDAQPLPPRQKDAATVKALLKTVTNDSVKCDLIQQLGILQLLKVGNKKANRDSALQYFQSSLKFCDSVKLPVNNRYESLLRIGEAYFVLNNFTAGNACFMSVIKAYQQKGDKKREARTWLRFAIKLKIADDTRPEITGYLTKALELYTQTGDREKQAEVIMEKGILNRRQVKLDSAVSNLLSALKIYQSVHLQNLARLYFPLSQVYRNKGDLSKALYYVLQTIDNAKSRGDTLDYEVQAIYYGQLGDIYSDLNDTTNSLKNYRRAVRIATTSNVGNVASDVTYTYATAIVRQLVLAHKNRAAIAEAGQIFKKYPPADSLQLGHQAEIWGLYYNDIKEFDRAEAWYLKAAKYYHCTLVDESWGNKILARFYMAQKKYQQAKVFLQKEFRQIDPQSQAFLNNAENEMFYYKIDSAEGNLAAALEHFRKYKQKSDSAFNVSNITKIAQVQVTYETMQREAAINVLQKDRVLLQDKVKQATYIRNLTVGVIALLLLLLALMINSYRLKQKNNKEIQLRNEQLNILLDDKDNLLEEKQWLLKEVHHRVKNNLQIVMGLLQRQSAYINNAEALAAIQNSENRMHSIALIHQKLYQSQDMSLICMQEYINEQINHLVDTAEAGSRLSFEKQIEDIYLDVSQAVPLGLILNEAITNAIKYAYPANSSGTISVYLLRLADQIILKVADNGKGLPANFNIEQTTSLGLSMIKGLSKQLSGQLELQNDNGLKISLSFKCAVENASSNTYL